MGEEVPRKSPAAADASDEPDVVAARAKHLPVHVAPSPDIELPVPARMINEVLYCERLAYLEWAQGEFTDNEYTVEGRSVHKRADQPGGRLPELKDTQKADDGDSGKPSGRPYQARSVWLSSDRLGISAKIDVVEGSADGSVVPIEYKRGKPPKIPEGAYLPERAQLAAHVLLLREAGYRCEEAALYFAAARRRVPIVIDDALIETTLGAARRVRALAEQGRLPPPLVDSPKCVGCSLAGICLPDEVHLLQAPVAAPLVDPPEAQPLPEADSAASDEVDEDADTGESPRVRRLFAARDDRQPMYVDSQGAQVGIDGGRLVVRTREGQSTEIRLSNTSHLCLLGNVQVTSQAFRTLVARGVPISFLSYGGWFYGRAVGHDTRNVDLRLAQYRAATSPEAGLAFANALVAAKIRNCRTMLRRNGTDLGRTVLFELEQLAKKAEAAEAPETLLGIEGSAARVYFGSFNTMLKGDARLRDSFDMNGRNRRPPRDPINALLSFTYSLLTKEITLAASAVGLDPLIGLYHKPHFGRPGLALDLMEEFRPLVADSVVIASINTGVVGPDDFVRVADSVALNADARKRLIQAYERRLAQLVTHPIFEYRLSYRRVLEIQARLFARWLLGELPEYPTFRTR